MDEYSSKSVLAVSVLAVAATMKFVESICVIVGLIFSQDVVDGSISRDTVNDIGLVLNSKLKAR